MKREGKNDKSRIIGDGEAGKARKAGLARKEVKGEKFKLLSGINNKSLISRHEF